MKNCQVAAVIALPQRGQREEDDAQLVPQLEQVEQLVHPPTFDTLPEQLVHPPDEPPFEAHELQ